MQPVLFVFGTRPEAIKLAPLILALRTTPDLSPRICVTAQHRSLLDSVLATFGIQPEHDLNIMTETQTLSELSARIMTALEPVIADEKPAMVVVQGDTTSTFCGALAGFYQRIPIAHVEAGLRTGDPDRPFPEEINRRLTAQLASLHLAPTASARQNLLDTGTPADRVVVTGNTGIDALHWVRQRLENGRLPAPQWPQFNPAKRLIVVTSHRRENFGEGMAGICAGLRTLAERPDVEIAFPMHPNPQVRAAFEQQLAGIANIFLLDPLGYVPFVDLMLRAFLLITDSGGIQEEGPALGRPILVLREKTERPEAVTAGTVELVGCDPTRIVRAARRLFDDAELYRSRAYAHNPYGDGHAAERIIAAMRSVLHKDRLDLKVSLLPGGSAPGHRTIHEKDVTT